MVHQIKSNFDFNLPNCNTNPLTTAIINKNEEAIKLLLNTNADLFYESPRCKLMQITILFRTNDDVEQLVTVFDTVFKNQKNEIIQKCWNTTINDLSYIKYLTSLTYYNTSVFFKKSSMSD